MVPADSKRVQPNLIGVLDLLHQVAQPVRRADRKTGVVVRGCEAVNSNLHSVDTPFDELGRASWVLDSRPH